MEVDDDLPPLLGEDGQELPEEKPAAVEPAESKPSALVAKMRKENRLKTKCIFVWGDGWPIDAGFSLRQTLPEARRV